ncbi:MAG: GNAT family N-acetyltransferase [Anaerolineae bacterium]|jgi:ribosomal protein S18 acetylase RimI-like enzyme
MDRDTQTIVRPFDGSLADAAGLLEVERATFDESPYTASQVQAMLATGPQRAWLALVGDRVVGFALAFATHGLAGPSWEIDLLAVRPEATRRGLATRLIRAASAGDSRLAPRARAVVATDNRASIRAFSRAGFRAGSDPCHLFVRRANKPEWAMPAVPAGLHVRPAADPGELAPWQPPPDPTLLVQPGLALLVALQDGRLCGYVELLQVETLLYRGLWIESLASDTPGARAALIAATLDRAAGLGLDEVGAMVPHADAPLRRALPAAGFRSLGRFHWLTARLPLPGLATAPGSVDGRGR